MTTTATSDRVAIRTDNRSHQLAKNRIWLFLQTGEHSHVLQKRDVGTIGGRAPTAGPPIGVHWASQKYRQDQAIRLIAC
jgi:hypothetical protein